MDLSNTPQVPEEKPKTFREKVRAEYWGWCQRGAPIILAVCFLAVCVFFYLAKSSLADVCSNACTQLGGDRWNTGSLGLECYCNANATTLKQKNTCVVPFFNTTPSG